MTARDHLDNIHALAERDGRYSPDAFLFVSEAVGKTADWIKKNVIQPLDRDERRGEGETYHVSGQELLLGIRRLAGERWGQMAPTVFHLWGVHSTEDFGEIVFLMVEDPAMQWRKRECDTREDFANGFSFETAFSDWN